MRILDPIHKYIVFSEQESRIVDSMVFQRLRHIRQLGFAEFAFPGAVHNRFLHSLGVYHLAGLFFDSLFSRYPLPVHQKKAFRQVVCLAALLHDVGHGPLSHNSEKAMPALQDLTLPFAGDQKKNTSSRQATHEHYSIKFILESEITRWITDMDVDPWCVAHLIDHSIPLKDRRFFISEGINFQPVLKQIISSDIDVDRMDYLQRDSFFCGVDYGFCDHNWIVKNVHIHLDQDQAFLAIGEKAIYSVENFLLGRRHISLALYFHNKMVALGEMLYRYFASPHCHFRIPSQLEDYVHCTDISLFNHLKADAAENEWARRIVNNQAYQKAYELRYFYALRKASRHHLQKIKDWLTARDVPFIHILSSSYVNYDIQGEDFKEVEWMRGSHDKPGTPRPLVYILDESKKQALPLVKKIQAFNHPDHVQILDRIYLSPEHCQKLSPELNKL